MAANLEYACSIPHCGKSPNVVQSAHTGGENAVPKVLTAEERAKRWAEYEKTHKTRPKKSPAERIAAKKKNNAQWRKENAKTVTVTLSNSSGIPEALQKAIEKTGDTEAGYVRKALIEKLRRNHLLPKVEEE